MKKDFVTVIYDRKKEVTKTGRGKVEFRIYLGNGVQKYVTLQSCNPFEWEELQGSEELKTQVVIYTHVVEAMRKNTSLYLSWSATCTNEVDASTFNSNCAT